MGGNKPRVSQEARRARVLTLKMEGRTDREIAAMLPADPIAPATVSHKTVNLDWHYGLDKLSDSELGKAKAFRSLAHQRLEALIRAYWQAAMGTPAIGDQPAVPPDPRAAEIVIRAIADIRRLFGLDRELGDPERPITIDAEMTIDYTRLTDAQLDALLGAFPSDGPRALPEGATRT